MAHIAFQVGTDRQLLTTRAEVLRSAGLRVVNSDTVMYALDQYRVSEFHLVVLCHTLTIEERVCLAAGMRQWRPGTPVFLMSYFESCPAGLTDVLPPNPEMLVRRVRTLLPEASWPPEIGWSAETGARAITGAVEGGRLLHFPLSPATGRSF